MGWLGKLVELDSQLNGGQEGVWLRWTVGLVSTPMGQPHCHQYCPQIATQGHNINDMLTTSNPVLNELYVGICKSKS